MNKVGASTIALYPILSVNLPIAILPIIVLTYIIEVILALWLPTPLSSKYFGSQNVMP